MKGWRKQPLGEACEFINGLWKGEKPPFVNIGVIRNTNFTKEGTLDDSDIAHLDVEARKFEKRRLKFGDLILEKSGGGPKQAVGRIALFDKEYGDFSFSNFTAALRVANPNDLDFRFLHKYLFWTHLSGVTETMQSNSTGIRNLDGDAYKAIEIPLPPLPEQRRIVGILDEAFAGIATAKANAEKNLCNARDLFERQLQEVFGSLGKKWVEKRLGDQAVIQSGGTPLVSNKAFWNGKIPWYSSGELNDLYTTEPKRFITDAGLDKSNAKRYPSGALLMGLYDTAALKMSILDREGTFNQAIAGVMPNENLNLQYVRHAVNAIKPQILALRRGVRQKNLSLQKIKDIVIPLSSLKDQNAIVAELQGVKDHTMRLESLYQQKLATLDALKKSLLHQAFSGQLTGRAAAGSAVGRAAREKEVEHVG